MSVRILTGDCRAVLKTLPDESAHCVVTSPPYWGLRDYGVAGQMGMERSFGEHVDGMADLFDEVRRVLRSDGTLWLNYGDSYATSVNGRSAADTKATGNDDRTFRDKPFSTIQGVLKPKDLCGIPWRVAFALQERGWWLRQDIIWSKPNPMPESIGDRCTKSHEYLFLLAKSERYYFDAEVIREDAVARDVGEMGGGAQRLPDGAKANNGRNFRKRGVPPRHAKYVSSDQSGLDDVGRGYGRNRRSVWTIATSPFSEAHFATFPPALIEPCILAGTSEAGCCAKCGAPLARQTERTPMVIDRSDRTHELGRTRSSGTMKEPPTYKTTGWAPSCSCSAGAVPCTVLDPFGGAGTSGLVADRLGRNAILIELNPAYAEMAERRLRGDAGMFAQVAAE